MPDLTPWEIPDTTLVVIPSMTFHDRDARQLPGFHLYEERLLFLLATLAQPSSRVVYVTSTPLDPDLVKYYLNLLPEPGDAGTRFTQVVVDRRGDNTSSLAMLLLRQGGAIPRLASAVGSGPAFVLPFVATRLEHRIADRLGLPLYGPSQATARFGTKSGGRAVAREAGVPVPFGFEQLYTAQDVISVTHRLMSQRPPIDAAVIKLNDSFSGLGNAIVHFRSTRALSPNEMQFSGAQLEGCSVVLPLVDEGWQMFLRTIRHRGAVVEELLPATDTICAAVQLCITPAGLVRILSTHDQIMGGPNGQVYLGCRFPADARYRNLITEAAHLIGEVLAKKGTIGVFGMDLLVQPSADHRETKLYFGEINLRLGGCIHPFRTAALATGGRYDDTTGELLVDGRAASYVATDQLTVPGFIGHDPKAILETLRRAGLAYCAGRRYGAVPHMLGALRHHGKLGVTCVAPTLDDSVHLYREVCRLLKATGPDLW